VNFAAEAHGARLQISSSISGQWSNQLLYAGDQLAVTGPFAVRGFRDLRLYGDRGAV